MAKLFSASQIKEWDNYTIIHEPISSIQLMERAANKCVAWIEQEWADNNTSFTIFCGNGNNGGDGLAIARMLLQKAYHVNVILIDADKRSEDNVTNLLALQSIYNPCIQYFNPNISIDENSVIIDAIFGTGLKKDIQSPEKEIIQFINRCTQIKISIDIPSGLLSDELNEGSEIVNATFTLSFQQYKKSFLFPESGIHCGEIILLDINLSKQYLELTDSSDYILTSDSVKSLYKKRLKFSHKGSHGKVLLIAGSHGMMGACILASRACIHSGAGLTYVLIPESENNIIQSAVPEVISLPYNFDNISNLSLNNYNALGMGCGMSVHINSKSLVEKIVRQTSIPLIIDADAINIIAQNKELLLKLPKNSLLTPHPKEFERLFGESLNSMDRNKVQIEMSKKYGLFILLKGHYTSISTPDGICYFNTSGNAGMAKGGTGDILTGIITALYGQYNNMEIAACMGAYIHGLAADIAESEHTAECMTASDIINCLGKAFKQCFY